MRESGYNVAELLQETDLYRLHAAFMTDESTPWCSTDQKQAVVAVIFSIEEDAPVDNDAEYWQSFESEMLPAITAACGGVDKIYVLNYVEDAFINYAQNRVDTAASRTAASDPIGIGVYSARAGEPSHAWLNGETAASSSPQSQGRRAGPAASFAGTPFTGPVSDARLTNIKDLRSFLQKRGAEQAAAEAQRQRDEAAQRQRNETAAAAARRAEETRQAGIARQAKIARRAEIARQNKTAKRQQEKSAPAQRKLAPPRVNRTKAAPPQKAESVAKLPPTLKTDGLRNAALITRMFEGDFVNIDFDRTDNQFAALYGMYLNTFARSCASALPPNRVEMTRLECDGWSVSTNIYGREISRTCVRYRTVGTDLFAKPAMWDALQTVDRLRAVDAGREVSRVFGDMTKPNAIEGMIGLIGDIQTITSDVNALLQLNTCTAPGLLRFEDNLRLFALNHQPIKLRGEATVSSMIAPPPGQAFKDQDYRKLILDLILDDTKRWGAFARFIPDSVTDASVVERDKLGRPLRVVAPYQWEGFGRTNGQVTLTFSDGLPECLIYSETSSVCHSPNRRIVARYLEGGYSQ